jgi:integrase
MRERERRRERLTDIAVKKKRPPELDKLAYEISDAAAPGLSLRVLPKSARHPHGLKQWFIRYKPKHLPQRRLAYGEYPHVSLDDARERARAVRAAAKKGNDLPAEEKKAAAAKRTVKEIAEEYLAARRASSKRARTWNVAGKLWEQHIYPAPGQPPFGSKAISEIRPSHIVALLDYLAKQKGLRAQVNRVRSQLIAFFNWAVEREHIETNPAATVKRRKDLEDSRTRTLDDAELKKVWCAAETLTQYPRALIQAWILTGQRRDEVRCMEWKEVDLDAARWLLPARRNKGKRDHLVPLSPAMVAMLRRLCEQKLGDYVFSVSGRKPYAGQKTLKRTIDKKAGLNQPWVWHDLRRTVATNLSAALKVPQEVIDRILNHARPGLARTYNLNEYLDEKRKALNTWAERVAFVVGEEREAPNVTQLRDATASR